MLFESTSPHASRTLTGETGPMVERCNKKRRPFAPDVFLRTRAGTGRLVIGLDALSSARLYDIPEDLKSKPHSPMEA